MFKICPDWKKKDERFMQIVMKVKMVGAFQKVKSLYKI